MFKKAIGIFASSILLAGCAGRVTTPSPPPPAVLSPAPELSSESLPPYRDESSSYDQSDLNFLDIPIPEKGEEEEKVEIEEDIKEEVPAKEEILSLIEEEKEEEVKLASLPPPDLRIDDILINSKKKLVVSITNVGETPLPVESGELNIFVDGALKGSYTLKSLLRQPFLSPHESQFLTTPLTLKGRHEIQVHVEFSSEVKELNKENNLLKKMLEGEPIGPDIIVKDFQLTEDLDLNLILSNIGESDLWRGATIRVRIHVNNRKISEFDHFVSETLKANLGNHYILHPPYRIGVGGISKVKVSIFPQLMSNDIQLENNTLKRTFIIFPFKIDPRGKEEFSFSFHRHPLRNDDFPEKMKVEARWEGMGFPLMLSFKRTGIQKGIPTLTGKSPLKVEFPIIADEIQNENVWNIFISNPMDRKVKGHLIIQHP